MFKKILVPLDGSQLAERSLALADALIKGENAEIILLSVPELPGYQVIAEDQSPDWDYQEAEDYLKEIQARKSRPKLTVQAQVIQGDEASVIVDTAVSEKVDLLVMSTHGRSGFGRWMLGSVAERVLRSAPCGMLVARSEKPIRKMLITLDGSPLSEQVIGPGLEVAQRFGAAVTFLRVRVGESHRVSQKARLKQTGQLNPDLDSRLSINSREYLDQLVESHGLGDKVKAVVLQGPVAPTIIEYVESENFDLIGMATHGFSAQTRWPYGQITEKVMRWVDASLLIVRS